MEEIEKKLGYVFKDKMLLQTALTHSSYANENHKSGAKCNERLEFLGDAVLGMTVAEELFKKNPDMPEGEMTRHRASLVCEDSLALTAEELKIGEYLRLGKGEEMGGGRKRKSILADAVEAVIAALYLDGGEDESRRMIFKYILYAGHRNTADDYKTELQELVQRRNGQVLKYNLTGSSGPDHMRVFNVAVELNGQIIGTGSGRSKKEAEQAAAAQALKEFQS